MLFKLIRYFSAPGLATIALVAAALVLVYQHLSTQNLLDHQARANTNVARLFANTVWPHYHDFVPETVGLPPDALKDRPELQHLEQDVRRQMRGLDVVKVKLYALNGITVFSSVADEIGSDKSANPGFQSARAGRPASEIVFRNEIYGFEGVVSDRNLVASYVPIRNPATGTVEAVSRSIPTSRPCWSGFGRPGG